MNKKNLYGFLLIFLSFVVMLVPMRAAAASNYYSGNITFYGANPRILLSSGISVDEYAEGYNVVHYSGSVPNMLGFTQEEGVTYNGQAILFEDYNLAGALPSSVTKSTPNIFLSDYTNTSGISIVPQVVVYDSAHVRLNYYIQFDNYTASYTGTNYIGFNVNMEQSLYGSDQVLFGYKELQYTRTKSNDWTGSLYEYVLIEDSPGYEGTVTNQNQTIINQSQTQNNLTTEQNTLIQNQINQQHSDSQAEINQSIQNTDQITNGYNSGLMGEAEDKFSSGAGDLTDIEDNLTDSSSGYVNSFTNTGFDTSFLDSVGPSLNYVVTWFTNFWNMGGALTSTYGLSFAIFIAFYILRVRG